jgi:hypothetical protein
MAHGNAGGPEPRSPLAEGGIPNPPRLGLGREPSGASRVNSFYCHGNIPGPAKICHEVRFGVCLGPEPMMHVKHLKGQGQRRSKGQE